MANRKYRTLRVLSSTALTPNMKRLVFSGEELNDFPADSESGYFKLLFTPDGEPISKVEDITMMAPVKPIMRTYTIRAFNPESNELTVDFALHTDNEGPASRWANNAKGNEEIVIVGPGPAKLAEHNADWFFFIGDMTSLPAISCNLELLPDSAKGHAVIEVATEHDIQDIKSPSELTITWLIKGKQSLLETIQSSFWYQGTPYIWCACEFSNMRALRKYFKVDKGIDKDSMYISSYWKAGMDEEQHVVVKRQDAIGG